MMTHNTPRSTRLILRLTPRQGIVMRRAAKLANKSLTHFILDRAYQVAEHTVLDGEQVQVFVKLLDRPVQDNPGLKDLLNRPVLWCN